MHYLIDGYNFLFRLGKKKQPLEKKRELLLHALNKEIKKLGLNATIVFDSTEEMSSRCHLGPLEIIYTTKNQSADDFILNAIEQSSCSQKETVVSSDRELTGRCKQLGAKAVSIEEFLSLIMQKTKKKKAGKGKIFKDSEREIERLLKIFEERNLSQ